MTTSPDSVSYPDQLYGVLGPVPAGWADVSAYGADPSGNEDSTLAFQEALASIPNGGRLLIPPGDFIISEALRLPSNTYVSGSGWSSRLIVAQGFVNPGDNLGRYSIFSNANFDADAITDSDITIENVFFDNSNNPTFGAFHHVAFRMAQRCRVINCRFTWGGDAVAIRACDDVIVSNCHASDFTNCAWDTWEGSNDIAYIGNYAATADSAQMANFNPETEPPYETGTVSKRFRCIGNTFDASASASVIPCQFEPLTANSTYVEDVTVQGNTFLRSRVVCRGDSRGVTIVGNTFRDIGSAAEVISVYPLNGGTPAGVTIGFNSIADAETTGANGGVIRCQTSDAIVVGNWIGGTAYTGQAVYVDTAKPSVVANRVDGSMAGTSTGLPKTLQSGFRVLNGSDNYLGMEDANGTTGLRIYVQTDNNLIFNSSDSSGVLRPFLTLQARSSTSELIHLLGTRFDGLIRSVPATALTATGATPGGALQLTANFNQVTTVSAGTGVRLPSAGGNNVTGAPCVVFNRGANTLNVYPPSGGEIDALGVDTAFTVAAGASQAFYATSNLQYYSW